MIVQDDHRWKLAETTPLPASFPKHEIGLMTAEEFIQFRDPDHKSHPSDSYDFDLFKLNQDYPHTVGTAGSRSDEMVTVEKLSGGYRVLNQGEVVAVIHNGTMYYDNPKWKRRVPNEVLDRHSDKRTNLGITSTKQVKYLSEVVSLISPTAKLNEQAHPIVLQRIIVQGEPMTVRAEKAPKEDAGVSLAIMNSDGLIVARATDEWGATLLSVAQEYRGKGLGKIIGKFWYEYNPTYRSGGFTEAGRQNALALWRDRVEEFASRGWYTALVRAGRMTAARVKEILAKAHVKERTPSSAPPPAPEGMKATGDILIYVDEDISFIVYDRAFLTEQDEKFIHGFGFFRDAPGVGVFLYRIDYDRKFAGLTTRVALQMARDTGEKLYDGEGYHDMIEVENIPGVEREGDYITVTKDLLPLRTLAQIEKRTRKAVDPHDELKDTLIEMAESKW